MERLGRSLSSLWDEFQPFSPITVMQIGLQMVSKRARFIALGPFMIIDPLIFCSWTLLSGCIAMDCHIMIYMPAILQSAITTNRKFTYLVTLKRDFIFFFIRSNERLNKFTVQITNEVFLEPLK